MTQPHYQSSSPASRPTPRQPERTHRRGLLAAGAAGAVALPLAFHSLWNRVIQGDPVRSSDSGPLPSATDETTGLKLLGLPAGFRCLSFGWTGDPLDDGSPTPDSHDGMAVIHEQDNIVTLCRNHERDGHRGPFGQAAGHYDSQGPGGCTSLTFNQEAGRWLGASVSLSGTLRNCAGGPTPWGSWLSCEETVLGPGDRDLLGRVYRFEQTHGWIFEVPAAGGGTGKPLKEMGRFVHEAVAVDPATSIVYETEDRQTAGFYRYVPRVPGKLAEGGRLQMMQAVGRGDLRRKVDRNAVYDVQWVDIEDPARPHHDPRRGDTLGVYHQGKQRGGTTFARLEGCWYADQRIYFDATSGGDAGKGQLWEYRPGEEQLRLLFESPGAKVLDSPDNLCVGPHGLIVMCEDGGQNPQRIHGLTPRGTLFTLAENHVKLKGERNKLRGDFRGKEWAGVSFSPNGKWLFANLQTPGITFAITGPWEQLINRA